MVGKHLLALLERKQLGAMAGMALLATALATGSLALLFAGGLKTTAVTGGWLGGIP